jgi:hypothetical protein
VPQHIDQRDLDQRNARAGDKHADQPQCQTDARSAQPAAGQHYQQAHCSSIGALEISPQFVVQRSHLHQGQRRQQPTRPAGV